MKIIRQLGKQGSNHCTIRLSQSEWQDIGKTTGWSQDTDVADKPDKVVETEPIENLNPVVSDIPGMEITVEKYGDRSFAVYVNGDLLCVTMYKKGAMAVKALLERMQEDFTVQDMIIRLHKEQREAAMGNGGDRQTHIS